eukprot:g15898.t1
MTRVPGKESRVGKKLSEKTTRRVILLVLVMMLVLPYLKVEDAQQFPTSAGYGADAFNQYLESNTTEDKDKYDKAMLQYIYYHNWFTKQLPTGCPLTGTDCSATFDSHVFWVGFVGKNQSVLLDRASKARVDPNSVTDMETLVTNTMQPSTEGVSDFSHCLFGSQKFSQRREPKLGQLPLAPGLDLHLWAHAIEGANNSQSQLEQELPFDWIARQKEARDISLSRDLH